MRTLPKTNAPRARLKRRPAKKLEVGLVTQFTYRALEAEVTTRRLAELRSASRTEDARETGSEARAATDVQAVADITWAGQAAPISLTAGVERPSGRVPLGHAGGTTPTERKALSNTLAALNAFRSANLIGPDDEVGEEIFGKFAFKRACLAIEAGEVSAKTVERHRNEMSARIRPWGVSMRRRAFLRAADFPSLLGALMADAGVSFDTLSAEAEVPAITLRSWTTGGKTPANRQSLVVVRRIEMALGTEPGMLERLCAIRVTEMSTKRLHIKVDPKEFKRVRRFLPADFEDRDIEEQREIYDWVWDNMILSPADDTIGRSTRGEYLLRLIGPDGAREAPEKIIAARAERGLVADAKLQAQVDALVEFKMADFPPEGMRRDKKWRDSKSARTQLHRLEMFFGALVALGEPKEEFGLEAILSRENIQAAIGFMRARRGAYTTSIHTMLEMIAALINPDDGFVRQSRQLFKDHPAARKEKKWAKACEEALKFIWERHAQVKTMLRVGRDPFYPLEPVLNAESPVEAYAKIGTEIRAHMPAASVDLKDRDRHLRFLAPFLYAHAIPLRAKNLAECLLAPPGAPPTPMTKLGDLLRAELWQDPDTGIWYHRQPKAAFKNSDSPVTGDVEIALTDAYEFYDALAEYISLRPLLLNGAKDPGTVFIKDMTRGNTVRPEMDAAEFGELWRSILQKFGIWNPYTGTGAIKGLRIHGPHAIRHVWATDAVKTTGGFAGAAAILFITEANVAKHYAKFLPQDRFNRAIAILNGEKRVSPRLAEPRIGQVLGAGSEKAMIRFVDQSRGLVVLDDLEKVGRRANSDVSEFSDINQMLKVSYNKTTGVKTIVDKQGNNQRLTFYGPKVITNISGLDPVNESRTFTVYCRPMPKEVSASGVITGLNREISDPLRQELHAWGMSTALAANTAYRVRMSSLGDRAKQIAAPLEVIADLSGSPTFAAAMSDALRRQTARRPDDVTPMELVRCSAEEIVARGARTHLSAEQLRCELALMPESMLLRDGSSVPEDLAILKDTRWLGRALLTLDIRATNSSSRLRLYGHYNRWYDLNPDFVEGVIEARTEAGEDLPPPWPGQDTRHAVAFCETMICASCSYASVCSSIMKEVRDAKLRVEGPGRR